MEFSVLMSVYKNDRPDDFVTAVESVTTQQTLKPKEVIIVVDGPVPDKLKSAILSLKERIPSITPVWLEKNAGLGNALRAGMEKVSYSLVARMDSDDISLPYRFEKQMQYMISHPDIAVCGGQISEFIGDPANIVAYRRVPADSDECLKFFRNRDPLNHVTVMLRKDAVLDSGNYQHWHLDEDTYLWGRMLKKGYKMANLPDTLVNVRVGEQMYARRGGLKYFKSDIGILRWKYQNGFMSTGRYMYNYMVRFAVQVAMPNKVREWVFKKMLRTK